jgi:hypothetical protein
MITGSDAVADARWLLDAQQRDPRVAALLKWLEGELAVRLGVLDEDRSFRTFDDLAAAQHALLARMAGRYARPDSQRRHPAAALMLAAVHRLGGGHVHPT